jgi:hypothetical protein
MQCTNPNCPCGSSCGCPTGQCKCGSGDTAPHVRSLLLFLSKSPLRHHSTSAQHCSNKHNRNVQIHHAHAVTTVHVQVHASVEVVQRYVHLSVDERERREKREEKEERGETNVQQKGCGKTGCVCEKACKCPGGQCKGCPRSQVLLPSLCHVVLFPFLVLCLIFKNRNLDVRNHVTARRARVQIPVRRNCDQMYNIYLATIIIIFLLRKI